jgi:hypothetical protein
VSSRWFDGNRAAIASRLQQSANAFECARGFGIGRGACNSLYESKLLSRINNGATLPKNSLIFDQKGLSPYAVIAVIDCSDRNDKTIINQQF